MRCSVFCLPLLTHHSDSFPYIFSHCTSRGAEVRKEESHSIHVCFIIVFTMRNFHILLFCLSFSFFLLSIFHIFIFHIFFHAYSTFSSAVHFKHSRVNFSYKNIMQSEAVHMMQSALSASGIHEFKEVLIIIADCLHFIPAKIVDAEEQRKTGSLHEFTIATIQTWIPFSMSTRVIHRAH